MILKAARITPPKFPRQTRTPAQRAGLAYQRKFTTEFRKSTPKSIEIQSVPWFSYLDVQAANGQHWLICSPDLLAIDTENKFVIVIEVKTTYTPLAFQKLRDVYCPVVSRALELPCKPLVVCKNLIASCPRPAPTISFALLSREPLFHWIGQGPTQW